MVEKGSIAIEGISLTLARWEPDAGGGGVVHVAIIPHTYARTNLHSLKAGQPLNIEADVLIKFMEQRSLEPRSKLSLEYLIANGY
jgi:riboflavin synthase